MNQELDKLNALITSLKMTENEHKKLHEKYEALLEEEKLLAEQLNNLSSEFTKTQSDYELYKKEMNDKISALKQEIETTKEQLKEKEEEKKMYFEIKSMQAEIERLNQNNEFLTTEIEDAKAGKITPGFSKYLQKSRTSLYHHFDFIVSQEDKQKLLKLFSKNIQVQKQNGILSMLTIKKIFDATILYYSKDYVQRTYQERIGTISNIILNQKIEENT
jgi:chromosome segregation ATPase